MPAGTAYHYQALVAANNAKQRMIILLTNQRQDNVHDLNAAIEAILDGKPYKEPGAQ